MADEWIMVRLRRTTHALLEEVRASLLRAAEQGQVDLDLDDRGRTSLDYVVRVLVVQRATHAARRKKANQQAGRRRRRPPPVSSPTTSP